MSAPLSTQQQAVADWVRDGSGSLVLVSRAGTGKTYTVVNGIIAPVVTEDRGELAAMAFNKAAAEEIKTRVARLAQDDRRYADWKRLQIGTAHSFGYQAWRKVAPNARLDEKKVLALIDRRAEKEGPKSLWALAPAALAKAVAIAKGNACGYLWAVHDQARWWELLDLHGLEDDLEEGGTLDELAEKSAALMQESLDLDREVIDFNDMLLAPLVHRARFWPKDWIVIDEAQDTNAVRRAIALKMLKPRTGRLVAVGDDRQAIYGFTGADSEALDLIQKEVGARRLALTVTYRCPKAVVRAANPLVPDLEAHPSAPEGVVRCLPSMIKATDDKGAETLKPWFRVEAPETTSAILCRNVKPLVAEAYAMLRAGLGCRVEGRDIGEGLLTLAHRWKRVRSLSQLIEKLEAWEPEQVQKHLGKGREAQAQAVSDKCQALREICFGLLDEGKTDLRDLDAWVRSLFGDTPAGQRPNVVTLSTVHKAKGREWPTVYILDRAGTMPSKWARKEWQKVQEDNLIYVAVTRAQRELVDLVV